MPVILIYECYNKQIGSNLVELNMLEFKEIWLDNKECIWGKMLVLGIIRTMP